MSMFFIFCITFIMKIVVDCAMWIAKNVKSCIKTVKVMKYNAEAKRTRKQSYSILY